MKNENKETNLGSNKINNSIQNKRTRYDTNNYDIDLSNNIIKKCGNNINKKCETLNQTDDYASDIKA